MDFGAHGNGKSDDSHVCVSALFALFSIFNLVCASWKVSQRNFYGCYLDSYLIVFDKLITF